MNRNFDYMRGELVQVLKNQEVIMDNLGIKTKRQSLLEMREILRIKEQHDKKIQELSEQKTATLPEYKKIPLVMVNCDRKDVIKSKKESNIYEYF